MADPTSNRHDTVDPSAWVDAYGDFLYRYALLRLQNAAAAEDTVQETFLAALRHRGQYAGQGAERAWLLGILKRKIIDHVRKAKRQGDAGPAGLDDPTESLFDAKGNWRSNPGSFGPQPDDALQRQEFWQAFRACLKSLPPRQADVFGLRELDGKSSEDICKDLGISASNLWVLLYRARMRLAQCLKSRWGDVGSD